MSRGTNAPEAPSDRHEHYDDHRGWVRPGGHRGRWLEPFALLALADGEPYGAALIAELDALCLAPRGVDAGMLYRTLREFEAAGLVVSHWAAGGRAPRRAYRLTKAGRHELHDWIGVMHERRRLTDAFLDRASRLHEESPGG
jgi:DNA-binding PadR family transcriptional regulator